MTDQSGSAAIFATAQGKLISSLAIIALLLGIMAEFISLATSAYNFEKTRSEATTACVRALAATCDALHPSEACQKKC